jgi:hypothetical protein
MIKKMRAITEENYVRHLQYEQLIQLVSFLGHYASVMAKSRKLRPGIDHVRFISELISLEGIDHSKKMALSQRMHEALFRSDQLPVLPASLKKHLNKRDVKTLLYSLIYLSGGVTWDNSGVVSTIFNEAVGADLTSSEVQELADKLDDFARFTTNDTMIEMYDLFEASNPASKPSVNTSFNQDSDLKAE